MTPKFKGFCIFFRIKMIIYLLKNTQIHYQINAQIVIIITSIFVV